jgi:hypothetical protein
LDEAIIRRYVSKVEVVMKEASEACKGGGPSAFFQAVVTRTEQVVEELERDLKSEGLDYPTPNEIKATARTIMWAAWTSWLWTAKAEREERRDENARRARLVFERLLAEAIEIGRRIGRGGGRPEAGA